MPERRAGRSTTTALGWAIGVTATELVARRRVAGRSGALLAASVPLGVAVALDRGGRTEGQQRRRGRVLTALGLTFGGYQLGRALLGDRPSSPPPDPLGLELVTLGLVVPVVEEAIWGARVEPVLGIGTTAAAFALKHPVVDGRWRRTVGLAAFWTGLGLLRRGSPRGALVAHVAANLGAVALGHLTDRDRF